MKILITTLNAKYIHTSLALRWIYVANKNKYNIRFQEFTIKEQLDEIAEIIIEQEIDVLGIGVYIWNVSKVKLLVDILKEKKPNIKIILGGPEVSYETEYFIKNWDIDYIVSGEAEFVFGELLDDIINNRVIDNIYIAHKDNFNAKPAVASIEKLEKLDSPYMLECDKGALQNRITYFETSRGCPYTCKYCLSSLEGNVRYFSNEYIIKQLEYLFSHNTKTIKFLDRTFNLNKNHTLFIFDKIKSLYNEKTICQFEIYADLLNEKTISYINEFQKDFIRFEIGIQSTYDKTNKEVNRLQDFNKIKENVILLQKAGVVDLHLDLIAGLPYETYDRFKKSFNDVFELKPKELQLGFLKMLRGTSLREQSEIYGYLYDLEGPYEIYKHNDLSEEDIENIKCVEDMLEKYWNSGRFIRTFELLTSYFEDENRTIDYFDLFYKLGQFYKRIDIDKFQYHLHEIYKIMYDFVLNIIDEREFDIYKKALFEDYYSQFNMRPKRFIEPTLNGKEKKEFINRIILDEKFMNLNNLTSIILYKYTYYEKINEHSYLLIIYIENKRQIIEYSFK